MIKGVLILIAGGGKVTRLVRDAIKFSSYTPPWRHYVRPKWDFCVVSSDWFMHLAFTLGLGSMNFALGLNMT